MYARCRSCIEERQVAIRVQTTGLDKHLRVQTPAVQRFELIRIVCRAYGDRPWHGQIIGPEIRFLLDQELALGDSPCCDVLCFIGGSPQL
jgi:hypothetical protein